MTGDLIAMENDRFSSRRGAAAARAQPPFPHDLLARLVHWGWGLLFYPLAAASLQGLASGLPAVPGPVPFTVAGTAVAVAAVSLYRPAHWGPIFAACLGLVAGATGSGLPGLAAFAYPILPLCCALLRDMIRREAAATFIFFVCFQSLFQAVGAYLGDRFAGVPVIPVDHAMVSIGLTVVATTVITGVVRGVLGFAWMVLSRIGTSD